MTNLEPPQIDVRRSVLSIIVALVVGFVLVAGIGRLAGFAQLGDTFDAAEWQWLVLCAVGQLAVFAGYAGAFRAAVAFPLGPVVERGHSLRVVMASFGLTQMVAAGGAAGLAFTYWALRQLGFERRSAVVRLIGLNTAVYLVFGLIGFAGGVLALTTGGAPTSMAIAWIVAIPLILLLARWFTERARVERWTAAEGGLRGALAVGISAAAWVRAALTNPRGRACPQWAVLYWAGDLLSLWAALRAFGADVGLSGLVLAYTTGYLAQSIPIPFLATGGVDAATTFTLNAVGVPVEVALLGVVAHRVFAFWIPIGPGLWSAFSLVRRSRQTADRDQQLDAR